VKKTYHLQVLKTPKCGTCIADLRSAAGAQVIGLSKDVSTVRCSKSSVAHVSIFNVFFGIYMDLYGLML
jgi:hypothetical protein